MYNKNELESDLNNLFRLLKLKAQFKNSINKTTKDKSIKVNKNKDWTPGINCHTTETFIEAVKKDSKCTKISKSKQPHSNVDKGREALRNI